MTFCVGVRVREGLVGLADTQIVKGGEVSSKAKLSLHEHGGHPFFVMTSGLRSVRDKVVLRLEDALGTLGEPLSRLHEVATAFGDELRNVRDEDGPSLEASGLRFNLHGIIGGQLTDDDEPALFMIYPEGNWVIATDDPPPSEVRQPQDTINLDKSPETLGALMKARGRGQRITIAPNGTTEVMTALSGWR